jgi:hypothetical protein
MIFKVECYFSSPNEETAREIMELMRETFCNQERDKEILTELSIREHIIVV